MRPELPLGPLSAFVALTLAACGSSGTSTTGAGGSGTTSSSTEAASGTASASGSGGGDGGVMGPLDCTPSCNHQTGTCGPLEVCSSENPCMDLNGKTVTSEINPPKCVTDSSSGRPSFQDGPPMTWMDDDGDTRDACVHVPAAASATSKVPLVVFLHGSHGSADDLYNDTSLRSKADNFPLSTSGGPSGFAVASMQGRNLHWLGQNPAGSHHDYLFRDLASPSKNPDFRSLDHLIDGLVATGKIDSHQIYVTGWSNGAFFAEAYAIARNATATPGGTFVAAAVPYAGADPFNTEDSTLPCQLDPYPTSGVPIFLIHRSCDALVPCDNPQEVKFASPPGYAVEQWKKELTGTVGDATVKDLIVDEAGALVLACKAAALCTKVTGTANHLRWPDGVADQGGHDHEPEMLAFMKAHPHP